jgi:hypothetical protein
MPDGDVLINGVKTSRFEPFDILEGEYEAVSCKNIEEILLKDGPVIRLPEIKSRLESAKDDWETQCHAAWEKKSDREIQNLLRRR